MNPSIKSSIRLRVLAFARSGDKGSGANVAVFVRSPEHYDWLLAQLTEERVAEFFEPFGVGRVQRFPAPNLGAVNFVLPGVLAGGASRSLRIDAQGKTLGQVLLEMELPAP